MVMYADVMFAVNFTSSYILLYLLAKMVYCTKPSKIRLCIASVIGGASSVILFLITLHPIAVYAIRAAIVIIMTVIVFYRGKQKLFEQLTWLLLMSGLIIFSMLAVTAVIKNTVAVIVKNGIIYFELPQKIFVISFIISYLLMALFLRKIKKRGAKRYYIMTITQGDKNISVTALFDSGNLLREPVTGKCVHILEWEQVKKLFDISFEFEDIEQHMQEMKLWVIPYNSLGNKSGVLFAFAADKIALPEKKKERSKEFIGIYNGILSKNKEYQALINAELL